jgi:hypothetical protein
MTTSKLTANIGVMPMTGTCKSREARGPSRLERRLPARAAAGGYSHGQGCIQAITFADRSEAMREAS